MFAAHFTSVEAGREVLKEFADRLAKVREFSNRDEDTIFEFEGAGAFYAVDLRKAHGASLETPQWADVDQERALSELAANKSLTEAASTRGLGEQLNESKLLLARRQSSEF
jgi:hypothetical protein